MLEIKPSLYRDCPNCPIRIKQVEAPLIVRMPVDQNGDELEGAYLRMNEVVTICRRVGNSEGTIVLMSGSKSGSIFVPSGAADKRDEIISIVTQQVAESPVDCPGIQAQSAANPSQG